MGKKRNLIIFCLLFCCLFSSFAENNPKLYWSFGTAGISYGDKETNSVIAPLQDDEFSRLILSGELGFSAKLDEAIRFVAGGNLVLDSFFLGSQNAIFLDYALFGGLRVYPGLGGFNLGLEYNTGRRTNFFNLEDEMTPESFSTHWGNGFRFVTEYDFSYYTEGLAPVIGISYRRMPRGGFADNFFTFYFRLAY